MQGEKRKKEPPKVAKGKKKNESPKKRPGLK
jgi:hypothetical protein